MRNEMDHCIKRVAKNVIEESRGKVQQSRET